MGVHFSAPDSATVDALHAQAKAMGANVGPAPEALPAVAGGGYGFRVSTPEGHPISISSDIKLHAEAIDDRSRPTKLTHVVLNSAEGGEADRVLPRRARLQVERFDLHDGLRALLLRPSQRGVRARQRADAQSHGL
jgi:hypothetical protein